jgi:hypothetical protein
MERSVCNELFCKCLPILVHFLLSFKAHCVAVICGVAVRNEITSIVCVFHFTHC